MSFKLNERKSRKRRLEAFSTTATYNLISAVQERNELWDVTNQFHFDSNALYCAWSGVADELNREVSECRYAWWSLRDSYRYHRKVAVSKRFKNGRSNGDPLDSSVYADLEIDWEFADAMSFLPMTVKKNIKTPSSGHLSTPRLSESEQSTCDSPALVEESQDWEEDATQGDILSPSPEESIKSEPADTYEQNIKTSPPKSGHYRSALASDRMLAAFEQLASQSNQLLQSQPSQPVLKHMDMYTFWDAILKGQPEQVIWEARFEVTNLLKDLVEKHKK